MKTFKKALSLLLCMCMLLSVMSVGLTAFAAEKTAAVTALEEKVNAYTGKLNVAQPDSDALAAYAEMTADFKALTQDQKESMDVMVFDKLYHYVIDRERQLSIINNPSVSTYNKQHYINAAAAMTTVLGTLPAYLEEAETLAIALADNKSSIDEKKAAYGAASPNARIMAGGYYASYGMFNTALNGSEFKGLKLIVDKIYAALLADNPAPARPSSPGSAPKASNYALGEDDPQYIADFEAWLEKRKAYCEAYANDYTYKGNLYLQAIEWVVCVDPAFKNVYECIMALRDAKIAYDSGVAGASSKAAAAVKLYDSLSAADKKRFSDISYTLYGTVTPAFNGYNYVSAGAAKLYEYCVDIGNAKFIDYFIVTIELIEEPYTRGDIDKARLAYNTVPSTLRAQIPTDILNKYEDILASIAPDEPTGERPNVEIMKSTTVKYPFALSKNIVSRSIGNLESVLLSALNVSDGNLTEAVKGGVYTNSTVALLASKLFPLLGQASSLIASGPSDLAGKLTEDKYAGARAALEAAAATLNEDGSKVGKIDAWQYLTVKDGDFGFNDGDREGFLDAVSALFRSLTILTMAITLENTRNTTAGTYVYGAYEQLVPVFEALGLEGVMSSVEYTDYVNGATGSELKMQRRIRAILVPIVNLLDSIAADPLNGILDLLPKLAYVTSTGMLNERLNNIILSLKFVSLDPVDLTTEGLFGIIAPMLSGLELKAAEYDDAGNEIAAAVTLSLTLDREKFIACFNDLAGCGKYIACESIARGENYYVGIDSDKTDAFMVLFRYLHSELTQESNIAAINEAVGSMNLGFVQNIGIKLLISIVDSSSADGALRCVVFLLPVASLGLSASKFLNGLFKK